MAYFQVESFHIDVGAGDGAIHLLTSAPAFLNNKRVVVRAILVDGGRATALDKILNLINWIQRNYHCQLNNGSFLVFDSFVITHWDGDHYEGVREFIWREIRAVTEFPGMDHREKVFCRRARYELADPITGFHGNPQSFIYMPVLPWPVTGLLQGANDAAGNPMLDVEVPFAGQNEIPRFTRLFKLRAGRNWLLGRNLFLHDADDLALSNRGNRNTFSSLAVMLQNHALNSPKPILAYNSWPGMYCVAAERRTLASDQQIMLTQTNMSSLVFIIVWNEPDLLGRKYLVSHYFAGDAHTALETAVATWMGNYSPLSMKLSHHGSSSSNPLNNFISWDPRNITVSAGDQYGHPSKYNRQWPCVLSTNTKTSFRMGSSFCYRRLVSVTTASAKSDSSQAILPLPMASLSQTRCRSKIYESNFQRQRHLGP
jgi:hypothetical protein